MPISIAVPVNKARNARTLKREQPDLDAKAIAERTGMHVANVKKALQQAERDKPKTRLVEARGPLTAGEVAEKLRIPYAAAKRATG